MPKSLDCGKAFGTCGGKIAAVRIILPRKSPRITLRRIVENQFRLEKKAPPAALQFSKEKGFDIAALPAIGRLVQDVAFIGNMVPG